LIGLLFPAFHGVQDQARKTQAKNDLAQIVTAVNAYYTEYGKYPLAAGITTDTTFGPGGSPTTNETLFTELRGCTAATGSCPAAAVLNTRRIVFISPPDVKDPANPRSGIATQTVTVNGVSIPLGSFVDPWGKNYVIQIDGDYNNQLAINPYTDQPGGQPLNNGVIVWSFGKNGRLGGGAAAVGFTSEGGSANNFSGSGDVISWQCLFAACKSQFVNRKSKILSRV